jgi:hypothetical protein
VALAKHISQVSMAGAVGGLSFRLSRSLACTAVVLLEDRPRRPILIR